MPCTLGSSVRLTPWPTCHVPWVVLFTSHPDPQPMYPVSFCSTCHPDPQAMYPVSFYSSVTLTHKPCTLCHSVPHVTPTHKYVPWSSVSLATLTHRFKHKYFKTLTLSFILSCLYCNAHSSIHSSDKVKWNYTSYLSYIMPSLMFKKPMLDCGWWEGEVMVKQREGGVVDNKH